ncbi:MAG: molybdenum cofactor biosynthesis protein MoeB [Euryarchaeota archaeon]|nr:molybdenum cofactor biosynthesis protein MoeB [Euryarchaeota archaeon]
MDFDAHRYARHITLPQVGIEGQERLHDSRVLVVGAGGLGSPVLLYLAAAGVGKIGIVDDDRVDVSNLQRQVIHATADVGQPKVESAKQRLLALNPDLEVIVFNTRLNPDSVAAVFSHGWDAVVDGTDNLPTRYLIDDACYLDKIPWVYGSIYRFEGQVSVFNHDGSACYRDVFPEAPPPNSVPSCEEGGVLGVLPGVIGSLQANEVIKILLGIGHLLTGRLLLYDAESLEFTTLAFSADPHRKPVTDLSQSAAMFADDAWCMTESSRGEIDEGDASSDATMFHSLSMKELLEKRTSGWNPFLLDVRSDQEHSLASVASCDFQIDHQIVMTAVDSLPKDREIVIFCRSGMRSQMAALTLIQAGYQGAMLYNLEGGIIAWQAAAPSEIVFG